MSFLVALHPNKRPQTTQVLGNLKLVVGFPSDFTGSLGKVLICLCSFPSCKLRTFNHAKAKVMPNSNTLVFFLENTQKAGATAFR